MTVFVADRMAPETAYRYLLGRSDYLEVKYQAMQQNRPQLVKWASDLLASNPHPGSSAEMFARQVIERDGLAKGDAETWARLLGEV